MAPDSAAPQPDFERYREYLSLLARLQVAQRFQAKIDLSGVVQMTLWEAHRAMDQLRGQAEGQRVAWLRRILVNNLADELRKLGAAKRDVARERSLEVALEDSSSKLEAFLAAEQSSPSVKAIRQEQLLNMARALATLPENQRMAVELHHLKSLPLADIAQEMKLSKPAVAGLLHRGLKNLRQQLEVKT
jgi:RNA polymerase sigma-70 factor (ECF subfamily)